MIDWAAISNAQYVARYTKAERVRDRRATDARKEAHRHFDRLWREGHMTRSDAYAWLAFKMEMPMDDAHMGMMTDAECRKVVQLSKDRLQIFRFERQRKRQLK